VAQVLGYLVSFGLAKRGLIVVVAACLLNFGAAALRNKPLYVILELSPLSLTAESDSFGRSSAQIATNVSTCRPRERALQVNVAGRKLDKKSTKLAKVVATAADAPWSSPTRLNSFAQGTGGLIDTLNHWFNIPQQVPITIARTFRPALVTGTSTPIGKFAYARENQQPLIRDAGFGGDPDTSKWL